MKVYQFFKIYKRFYKKGEKNSHTIVNEKRKTEKSWDLFYLIGYFMKPLKMAVNHFFFNPSRHGCISDASLRRLMQHLRDISKRADLQISEVSLSCI